MSGVVKRVLNSGRDRLLARITKDISSLSSQVKVLERERTALKEKCDQINNKLWNSGVIQISDREILAKTFLGLKVYLDPRDISVTPSLALDGIYEHHICDAWISVLKPTDTVIDIGANFGYYGAIAAQRTDKKHSKVVFFEANPNLIPYIRKTLAVNWLNEQSVIENLAISDEEGEAMLNVLKDYIGSSSLHTNKHVDQYMHNKMYLETEEAITVHATTLDAYCEKHKIKSVDLIKMDIEGFEDRAYKGMQRVIKQSPNVTMFLEFTKDSYDDPEGFFAHMYRDFGNVYTIKTDGGIARPKSNSYEAAVGGTDDWVMLIFSKNNKLAG